jgi:hypothetical protein
VDLSEPHDDICGRLNSSLNVYNDNDSEYNIRKKDGHNDNIYGTKNHENSIDNRSDEGFNFVYTNTNHDNLNNNNINSNEIYSNAVHPKKNAETLNYIYNDGLVWSPYMNNKDYGGNNNSNNDDGDDNDKYNNDIDYNNNHDKNCNNENEMNIHIHNENKKLNDEKKMNQLNRYVCTALYVLEEYRQKIIHDSVNCIDNDSHNYNDNNENSSNNNNDNDNSYEYDNINYDTNDNNHSNIDSRNLHENGRDLHENRKNLHEKNGMKSSSTVIVKCEAMELILETLHHW